MRFLRALLFFVLLVLIGIISHFVGRLDWSASAQVTPIRTVQCNVAVSTATTLTAVAGDCAAPGANLSLYITDIIFSSSIAGSTAADSFPTLKSGTGTNCGTGTAVIWSALNVANDPVVDNRVRPIRVPANSDVCWIHSGVGSKVVQLGGFIGPS